MSSNIFASLDAPASYEADIDEGWREIPGDAKNPIANVFQVLQEIYWDAVKDEMANALLAFDDYKTFVPDGLPELHEEALESDYLRELLDLWEPLELSEETKNGLCETILHNVKGRQKVPQDVLVATALLQACGFTDYDYVQEYRKPTFPSLAQAPSVDAVYPGVYEAIQCSECRFCIRSFHFYECKKQCLDCNFNRNHIKTVPEEKTGSGRNTGHIYLDMRFPVPFRLCCNCLEKTSHPRDHLKVVWRFKKAGDTGNRDFSRELDALEDHIKGQGLLSFGNAFLDYMSASGRRFSSMHSRHLFPAGNAHCAYMFGPLLIENGMTIHPGGAMISTRPLPSLGRYTSQEVKEYLNPEAFRTINGCDTFCAKLYSVSPSRRIYQASKRSRPRRFLCSRKQLSGGLFTDYNSNITWKLGEERIIKLFLAFAYEWRAQKSLVGLEEENRALLKECAAYLTEAFQMFFADEIKLHLFLIAQKLGKTQKLAYSRMGNNCQDFCNGLLTYGTFLYPTFDQAMYPFIPVSLSLEIEKEPDDHCLSYLQSFAKPLQYPIQGSQSRRAMVGSAVTMYSSFSQNDADLIDHVWGVRFGYDRNNDFQLGFKMGDGEEGDAYLLKDEEMSCSDRFAASLLPGSQRQTCTLADHLLDYPVDNLSVLQTHIYRQQKYYYDSEGEFLSNLGPKKWITNRLEVFRRLKLMHDFLAEIAVQFQDCCKTALPPGADVKALRKIWDPKSPIFSRAFHMDKRSGNTLYFAPDIDFGDGEMSNWKAVGFFTLGTTLFETHRQLMESRELFSTRLRTLKSQLSARLAGKEETWSPWKWCTCSECKVYKLEFTCSRLDQNYLRATDPDNGADGLVKPGHPDYVPPQELEKLLENREDWKDVVEHFKHRLEMHEEHHQSYGSRWVTTNLLCLRGIFGTADTAQQIVERLEYYKAIFEGKISVSR